MRLAIVVALFGMSSCGGKAVAPGPTPIENVEQPRTGPPDESVSPPQGWEPNDVVSDDGAVKVRYWLPTEADGMVYFDAAWTGEGNRYELVGELRGNHLRFWELKAAADEDFAGQIEIQVEDEGAELLADEKVGPWRHVRLKIADGESTMVRRGRVVCQGANTDKPDVLETLVKVCELIKIER